jgi:hypothetical protein
MERKMPLENAISSKPVREKLVSLRKYLPGDNPTLYRFGELLGDTLDFEQIVPKGFVAGAERLLYKLDRDLERYADGLTGKPVKGSKFRYELVLDRLHDSIPKIAQAVGPQDFARDVKDFYEKVFVEKDNQYYYLRTMRQRPLRY